MFVVRFGEEYKLSNFTYSVFQPPFTASLLGPDIHPSTLFSNTLIRVV
jgi:hypothetical protein